MDDILKKNLRIKHAKKENIHLSQRKCMNV